ncbi:MAG: hydroxymethylglutaryl-CoA reductase, degradative [Spirochaetales bacterium]
MDLPRRFRKLSVRERRAILAESLKSSDGNAFGSETEFIELADIMVESAVGYLPLPVGIATGFLIDNENYAIPMATEEPSVIAAASFAAATVARAGGFITTPGRPITIGQVHVGGVGPEAAAAVIRGRARLEDAASEPLARMTKRGGGLREIRATWLEATETLRVEFEVDVQAAMGANLVNTVAERLRPIVEELTGGEVIMAILSNAAPARIANASFALPVEALARAGRTGAEIANRIVTATKIADADPHRAVTHNKGIMNGLTALALATGNDTRALEAAVHSHAASTGSYRSLTSYEVRKNALCGSIALPVVLASVGGAAGVHPTARAGLELLGGPSHDRLASIAVSLGLAQNLAALWALVSEGIQTGHMGLHANRLAWMAGARGSERAAVVDLMKNRSEFSSQAAEQALREIRGGAREQ